MKNLHFVFVILKADFHDRSDECSDDAITDNQNEVRFVLDQFWNNQVDKPESKEPEKSREEIAVSQDRLGNDEVSFMVAVREEQRRQYEVALEAAAVEQEANDQSSRSLVGPKTGDDELLRRKTNDRGILLEKNHRLFFRFTLFRVSLNENKNVRNRHDKTEHRDDQTSDCELLSFAQQKLPDEGACHCSDQVGSGIDKKGRFSMLFRDEFVNIARSDFIDVAA